MNLPTLTERFKTAVELAEKRWTLLRHEKFNPRLLTRYVRSLRRCERIRNELRHAVEAGTL